MELTEQLCWGKARGWRVLLQLMGAGVAELKSSAGDGYPHTACPVLVCPQLMRFELAVGMTNCTAHDDPSFHIASATTPAPSDEFVLPQFQADAHDGLFCRKLAGQNFRDVQERCVGCHCQRRCKRSYVYSAHVIGIRVRIVCFTCAPLDVPPPNLQ